VTTTKASLTLTLVSLLAGCSDPSALNQAVTAPSSTCVTAGTPGLQGAITLELSAPATLVSGTTAPVTATAIDSNGARTDVTREVTWSSSDLLAASTDKGTLYAIGVGTTMLRATLGEVTATARVDIVAIALQALILTADSETARSGALTAWHVTGQYNDGSTVDMTGKASWSTSDADIAIVELPGQIRATGAGMAMVSASVGGQQASLPLLVSDPALVDLRIDATSTTMSADGSQQLVATGVYSDGSTANLTNLVGWYTSDGSLAAVTGGRVQAVSSGSVTISAASDNVLGTITLTLQ
jgi:hypothetical protein